MEMISIEEHQRLMYDLHRRTKESTYREMDYLAKAYESKLSFWKVVSLGLFITTLTMWLL